MTLMSTFRSEQGKQEAARFGIRGSAASSEGCLHAGVRRASSRAVAKAENRGFGALPMPKAAESPLLRAFCCFPLLPRLSRCGRGSKIGHSVPILTI
jgi:hypothetical protein